MQIKPKDNRKQAKEQKEIKDETKWQWRDSKVKDDYLKILKLKNPWGRFKKGKKNEK